MKDIKYSIRFKLFFLVLVAFTALIVATVWQIGEQANKVSSKSIVQALKQSSVVLETKIDSRFNTIEEVATSIAKDSRVLPLVFDSESLTLQDLSTEFQRVLEFNILFFTDAQGTILARSDRPEAIGRTMAGKSALFDSALAGKAAQGVFVSRGEILQIVVVPIFDNVASDLVRGTVALAYEFSKDMATEINALTASDISVFIFTRDQNRKINGVKTSYNTNNDLGTKLDSFFSENQDRWRDIYDAQSSMSNLNVSLDDESFFSVIHSLRNQDGRPLGFVMALRSRTELLKPFLDIQRTVIIIGFICLIGASIFAWLFSLRISKPIIKLVSVAKNIQEGHYTDFDNDVKSKDEVGALYKAVVKMGKTLKEKAELEQYLAQMSDELNIAESVAQDLNAEVFAKDELARDELVNAENRVVDDTDKTIVKFSIGSGKHTSFVQAGEIVDKRYKILRHIGAGAMGTVFLAHDLDLDERVAIKIMAKELFSQQESVNFKEEIRLARRITHRNILRTFDFGNWQNYYYITMEYLSGYDLGALLKNKGAFDAHVGVVMARQICSAMNAAHEEGIIHRDLKPSNMMINRQGILKIMDFGLAMNVGKNKGQGKKASSVSDNNLANDVSSGSSNLIAGTPRYMAPEQFFGWPLDERTDIYAIGVILYTIFNGRPPFNDNDFDRLAQMHLRAEPPKIKGKNGKFPEDLQHIIAKAIAKKPEDRYQSVREILDVLH
ncbi:protein kinase domain-containing protein [Agarilytica rhodophyticola]|uniref:protein kinase domain-containing protein n=1 Tax=Agarilytica rhodophyticola TaxID=1737490 RepID=UPI00131564C7|nr:protein kinase [Agarilytica rhodophyticola]